MDYVARITSKYPWLSEEDAEEIIAKAKMFYYGIVYKSDISHYDEDDEETPRKSAWLLACCDEIVERAGCSSATAYRENGLQMNFDHSQISLGLINMLSPVVGVIKR